MTRWNGWAGSILNVYLDTNKIEKEPLSPVFARKYIGASGFNSAKLFDLVGPDVDALSPKNVLLFGAGPLSGTLVPGCARLTVTAKSPLTDIFGDANVGGFFAAELKYAGYDQIVVFGKSKQPVYLWIDDDEVRLRDASHLWGKSTWETAKLIREELGDLSLQVLCIGQAGENLVRYANIIGPTKRAAGRAGMGAVMGSKNLKAIAVRGSRNIAVARPEEFIQTCREITENVVHEDPRYHLFHEYGTPGLMEMSASVGGCGVRNYQRNLFPNLEAISGRRFKKDFATPMRACFACHVACGTFHSVKSGEFAGIYAEGPEFGLTQLGLRCGIDNMPALLKMDELFNQYGIDYVSAAANISWAMDLCERNILTKKELGGTLLSWGDYNAVIEMIPKIAKREGFGNILAEGEKRAPKLVGKDSEKFMYHVKGMAPVDEDPRANRLIGLAFHTGTRGADHLKGNVSYGIHLLRETDIGKAMRKDPETLNRHSPTGKGMVVKWCEDNSASLDAMGVCTRTGGVLRLLSIALSSATGVDFSEKDILMAGERIFNVQKAFNSRQGLARKDDNFSVPEKFTQESIKEGTYKGGVVELDLMLNEYYKIRGWDQQTGLQTRKKLEELGLEQIIEQLERVNAVK